MSPDQKSRHMAQDQVIFHGRLHWIIFIAPLCCFFGGMLLGLVFPFFKIIALLLVCFGLLWLLMAAITYHVSSLILQQNQVIISTGLLVRQTMNIPLIKIESIDIRQSILGSLLHYGTLMIVGTGGTRYGIMNLTHPLTCRRHIEQFLSR